MNLMSDRFEATKKSLQSEGMCVGRGKPGWGHGCPPVLAWGG